MISHANNDLVNVTQLAKGLKTGPQVSGFITIVCVPRVLARPPHELPSPLCPIQCEGTMSGGAEAEATACHQKDQHFHRDFPRVLCSLRDYQVS